MYSRMLLYMDLSMSKQTDFWFRTSPEHIQSFSSFSKTCNIFQFINAIPSVTSRSGASRIRTNSINGQISHEFLKVPWKLFVTVHLESVKCRHCKDEDNFEPKTVVFCTFFIDYLFEKTLLLAPLCLYAALLDYCTFISSNCDTKPQSLSHSYVVALMATKCFEVSASCKPSVWPFYVQKAVASIRNMWEMPKVHCEIDCNLVNEESNRRIWKHI